MILELSEKLETRQDSRRVLVLRMPSPFLDVERSWIMEACKS